MSKNTKLLNEVRELMRREHFAITTTKLGQAFDNMIKYKLGQAFDNMFKKAKFGKKTKNSFSWGSVSRYASRQRRSEYFF